MLKIFSYSFLLAVFIVIEVLSIRFPLPLVLKIAMSLFLLCVIISLSIQLYKSISLLKKRFYLEAIKDSIKKD
jgi:hypothetical protein